MTLLPAPIQPPPPGLSDPALVARARGGDQAAFGDLVARHQTLVASLAYSICGDFACSLDLAQEAFVAAWRQLATLEDPAKFKPWLCGITRHLAHNFVRLQFRRGERLPPSVNSSAAAPDELASEAPGPREQTVTREESALVWRALEQLAENYREPLVLFYREHHSIERVATALDLSEEVVKQRLTRGRALLRDQIEGLVDRSLAFTTPGTLFTTAVVSSLSATTLATIAGGTTASTAGAFATKGSATVATWSGTTALSVLSALAAPFAGLAAALFGAHVSLRSTRDPAQRGFVLRLWIAVGAIMVIGPSSIAVWAWWVRAHPTADPQTVAPWLFRLWPLLVFGSVPILFLWARRRFVAWARQVRLPADASPVRKRFWFGADRALAYRSRWNLFGLPLLDIRFGASPQEPLVRGTARGWIALGDVAHGIVLAVGGVAIGGIALGGVSVGLASAGAIAIGAGATGGLAAGGVVYGIVAIGYVAFGAAIAIGFQAALGTFAVAKHIAFGLLAFATHTRGIEVAQWVSDHPRFMSFLSAVFYIQALIIGPLAAVATNWFIRASASPFTPAPQTPHPRASRSGA